MLGELESNEVILELDANVLANWLLNDCEIFCITKSI
jgi:hypothetical protein